MTIENLDDFCEQLDDLIACGEEEEAKEMLKDITDKEEIDAIVATIVDGAACEQLDEDELKQAITSVQEFVGEDASRIVD